MKSLICVILLGVFCSLPGRAQEKTALSLRRAVQLALDNHPQVRIAQQQIAAQRGAFWKAIAPPPPTVSVNYDFIPKGEGLKGFSERTVEFAQTIDFPTTLWLKGALATAEVDAAEIEYAAVAADVTAQTKIAYACVLAKKQKLELARENLAIAEDFLQKSTVRRNVGESTHLEQLTAAVQRVQAVNAVEAAQNDLRAASDELLLRLGVDPRAFPDELSLSDSVVFTANTYTLEQLCHGAAVSNTQMQESVVREDIAAKDYALAWSGFLPSLSASYFRQTRDGASGLYGVSFGVSVPLWFLFDQRGQLQSAQAKKEIAAHERRIAENAVRAAVKTLYFDMVNNERQVHSYQTEILPQSSEILRASKASFDAGEISYLEFLQARQTAIQAKAGWIDAVLSYTINMAKLEQTIGKSFTD